MARNKRGKPSLYTSSVPERGTHRHNSLCVISENIISASFIRPGLNPSEIILKMSPIADIVVR